MPDDEDWQQLPLFGTPTPARRTDPQTSDDAAASVNRFHARELHLVQLRMLLRFNDRPDLRTHEGLWLRYNELRRVQESLPLVSVSGFRTRLSELKRAGYARDSGVRGPMSTGRNAVVWEITSEGASAASMINRQKGRTQ